MKGFVGRPIEPALVSLLSGVWGGETKRREKNKVRGSKKTWTVSQPAIPLQTDWLAGWPAGLTQFSVEKKQPDPPAFGILTASQLASQPPAVFCWIHLTLKRKLADWFSSSCRVSATNWISFSDWTIPGEAKLLPIIADSGWNFLHESYANTERMECYL